LGLPAQVRILSGAIFFTSRILRIRGWVNFQIPQTCQFFLIYRILSFKENVSSGNLKSTSPVDEVQPNKQDFQSKMRAKGTLFPTACFNSSSV
jgi:hypothetical protein